MTDYGDRLTQPTDESVAAFLAGVAHEQRRRDAQAVCDMMATLTGVRPQMWGGSMVGFGHQPYTTADGKQRDWFAVGLSPRKAALTLYGLTYYGSNTDLLTRLGAHTLGKGCLHIKRLDDIDGDILAELIVRSWRTNSIEATRERDEVP